MCLQTMEMAAEWGLLLFIKNTIISFSESLTRQINVYIIFFLTALKVLTPAATNISLDYSTSAKGTL